MHIYRLVSTMPRPLKRSLLLGIDIALVPVALVCAVVLQTGALPHSDSHRSFAALILMLMAVAVLLSLVLGTHRIQLKAYDGHAVGLTAIHAALIGLSAAALGSISTWLAPFATYVTFTLLYLFLAVALRAAMYRILLAIYQRGAASCRVLVYGVGRTGRQLVAALGTDRSIIPMAFVDDDPMLQSTILRGLRVHHPRDIPRLMRERSIDRVLLAMPSLPRPRLTQISRRLEDLGLDVQTVPSFAQLTGQEALSGQLRPVAPGAFLGRAPLDAEIAGGSDAYVGKSVLISGAGGTIGAELCRYLLACRPSRLILFEASELALYTIEGELREVARDSDVEIVCVLGSVTDAALVRRVMRQHDVQIVLHAAAYKHVAMVECNPAVGVANNVLGTQVLAQAAGDSGAERFILISSDKAVRPSNMMGASKRLSELVVQDLASRSPGPGRQTVYAMVRFGNVIGSSGSVIPKFQDQIARGGPVTLTDREVTRYFMTISEAARLVLLAGSFAESGGVFLLDMGAPVAIQDLARQMIRAAGCSIRSADNPDGDIEIVLTGLGKGEKMREELLIGEGQITTSHPKIMRGHEERLSQIEVAAALRAVRAAASAADDAAMRNLMSRWIAPQDADSGNDAAIAVLPRTALPQGSAG